MSFEFIWQLPARGDARYGTARPRLRGERYAGERPFQPGVTDPRGKDFNHFDYLHQVARGAELSGFDGVRVQHDAAGDESWIIAGYVARGTRSLKRKRVSPAHPRRPSSSSPPPPSAASAPTRARRPRTREQTDPESFTADYAD